MPTKMMSPTVVILIVLSAQCVTAQVNNGSFMSSSEPFPTTTYYNDTDWSDDKYDGIHLISWNFDYVAEPLILSCFVLLAGLLKLAFHSIPYLSSIVPESCLLIIVGLAVGGILYGFGLAHMFQLTPRLFMLILLPPIVLDSAYSLNDRVFAENLGTILLYAVLGTLLNFFALGPTLWGLSEGGAMGDIYIDGQLHPLTLVECMLFASFIIAVDPVAVLAIFQEVGVNNVLYFLVFGESLMNDAVTVVLNNMMKVFNEMDEIPAEQIVLAVLSFFTISLGGLSIGLIMGILTALITRCTTHVRVVEPLAVLTLAYLSFLCAELFHWSGIISCIGCGLVQAHYAFHNISRKSYITVKYFSKMISSTSDSIIFMFLGLEVITTSHYWHTGFVLWTIFYCLVYRFVFIFGLTLLANLFGRMYPIGFEEQFIQWYGGLRGAVCFALCDTLSNDFPLKSMFLTTTLVVIFFTVFIQGMTIKPLVSLCRIRRKTEKKLSMFEEIDGRVNDHMMAGIERIVQHYGKYSLRKWFYHVDDSYFRQWLQTNPSTYDQMIIERYGQMVIKDYEATIHKNYFTHKTDPRQFGSKWYTPTDDEVEIIDTETLNTEPALYAIEDEQKSPDETRKAKKGKKSRRSKFLRRRSTKRKTDSDFYSSLEELHRLISNTRPATIALHQRHDRNMINEDEQHLISQLQERHLRVERLKHFRLGHALPTQRARTLPEQRSSISYFDRPEDLDIGVAKDKQEKRRPATIGDFNDIPETSHYQRQITLHTDSQDELIGMNVIPTSDTNIEMVQLRRSTSNSIC